MKAAAKKQQQQTEALTATVDQRTVQGHLDDIDRLLSVWEKALKGLPAEIEDEADYKLVCSGLLELAARKKRVLEERSEAMREVQKIKERIDGLYQERLDRGARVEDFFRTAIEGYNLALAAKATGLRRAAAHLPERDAEKAHEMLMEASALAPPKIAGIAIVASSELEIIDEAKIPEQFFKRIVDKKLVQAALEAGGAVPGCRLVAKVSVRATPKHAKKEQED